MTERFGEHPKALREKTRRVRLGPTSVPALLAHPDWSRPAPVVLWMHGRSVSKELDPGRYLRWIRAGIAACAIDLPGHGERFDAGMQGPDRTLNVVEEALPEIDQVVEALADPGFEGVFDLDRVAIGGMSAGGIVSLRRLCNDHPFVCAAVESTVGDFDAMGYAEHFLQELVERLDPMRHLGGWRPIPILALHTEADEWAPVASVRNFVQTLKERYEATGADPESIEFTTWPETGAPYEHAGFGRFANDAKNIQTDFFTRRLNPEN